MKVIYIFTLNWFPFYIIYISLLLFFFLSTFIFKNFYGNENYNIRERERKKKEEEEEEIYKYYF